MAILKPPSLPRVARLATLHCIAFQPAGQGAKVTMFHAAFVIALFVVLLSLRRRHDRVSGATLLDSYAVFYMLWLLA
jgi:hypothetical protein